MKQEGGVQDPHPIQREAPAPVVLNSIHNDGLSLELKIKDIVQRKMETFESKWKIKDDKMLIVETSLNRQEKQFKDTITAVSDATQQELDKVHSQLYLFEQRIEQANNNHVIMKESMLHEISQNIISNLLP